MKRNWIGHALVISGLFFVTVNANALLEVRAHYGILDSKPDVAANLPTGLQLSGLGADIIFSPPIIPLAVGLRYESMAKKDTNAYGKIDVALQRTAAFISFRPLDTLLFLGACGTLGFAHTGRTLVESPVGTEIFSKSNTVNLSYSVGVEGGVKLVGFLVGAELGYIGLKIKGGNGVSDIKLDGIYAKALAGLTF